MLHTFSRGEEQNPKLLYSLCKSERFFMNIKNTDSQKNIKRKFDLIVVILKI